MDDKPTYQKIADHIRDQILAGVYHAGDRLPGVREFSEQWSCTPGTTQRAFDQLVRAGLLESKPGKGTFVSSNASSILPFYESYRRSNLVVKTEQFILENISSGYSLADIFQALNLAAEHWRVIDEQPHPANETTIRFSGSSDNIINRLATELPTFLPGIKLEVEITGSMSGIVALAQGNADVAGCHLWDPEEMEYNIPYLNKLLPGRKYKVVTLSKRNIGILTAPGNPKGIRSINDLVNPGVTFVNRQNGSGTRVWLDQQLMSRGISPTDIQGYEDEKKTHTEIARTIAVGKADVGIGLAATARSFNLDCQILTCERYDLVALAETAEVSPVRDLFDLMQRDQFKHYVGQFYGYEASETGSVQCE